MMPYIPNLKGAIMAENEDRTAVANTTPAGASADETEATAPESKARGMLRDVIHKVMEEIEHHETEARRHLQQAAGLRRDLRESLAFLQAEGEKRPRTAVPTKASPQPSDIGTEDQTERTGKSRKRRRKR
jgi:hypothetical protein